MLLIDEYLPLRENPRGLHVMHQQWRDLLFLHFSTQSEVIQALLPEGLTVDTFPDAAGDERAWVGLVAFRMEGIRSRGLPALPGVSAFPETNVRTYVHREGRDPGVWFFSLDADHHLACQVARATFGLPYWHGEMSTSRTSEMVSYSCKRGGTPSPGHEISARLGDELAPAEPGTLEFFLIERYLLHAMRFGRLMSGQVAHPPYPLRSADVLSCEESLVAAAGIEPRPWEHVLFSDGVDVRVHALA